MDPSKLLHQEALLFLSLVGATLIYRALTGRLVTSGLLSDRLNGSTSPERVQLLIATLAIAGHYLRDAIHGNGTTLPSVNITSLLLFGGSSGIYAAVKYARLQRHSGSQKGELK
ncbi:hypothetical protein [Terriglobus roseus]|uniref:hypothetical protein n=1 Tax=Terriglobus roseus TaxID=392734 RepID=UPI001BAE9620|nr:hypothetical protein [Terriglobus roseus]